MSPNHLSMTKKFDSEIKMTPNYILNHNEHNDRTFSYNNRSLLETLSNMKETKKRRPMLDPSTVDEDYSNMQTMPSYSKPCTLHNGSGGSAIERKPFGPS